MRYLSVCSGIEAASVAWHPLYWEPLAFSEIEAFPRAVLAHHYPDVPCHGDFTKLRDMDFIVDADVFVGGTPCQAFSVAGLRKSLDDDRGNLSLEFVRLADAIDDLRHAAGREPAIVVWENVPGVLSVKDNAFGCFLAGLAGDVTPYDPPRGKWTDAGVVDGPQRTVAWRVLDAQYFGLAQRRRRVFVVASSRKGFDPAAVLLEWEGVRRDTPPRREAGEGSAHSTAPCLTSSGRGVERTGDTRGQDPVVAVAFGGNNTSGPLDVATARNACSTASGRLDFESETFVVGVCPTLRAGGNKTGGDRPPGTDVDTADSLVVTHSLRGEGLDASEDGTGRGTPLVPVAYRTTGNDGVYETGNLVHALTTATDPNSHVIGFSAKDHGADATEDLSPTLRSLGAYDANGGGQMAVAVQASQSGVRFNDTIGTLDANYGSRRHNGVMTNMAVRRLTPVECERLQGFPDNYTLIPWRNKAAADCPDGPRYKALGNSMAVPVMRWIGKRISEQVR